jgi:ATP-dependent DNA helicase RecG
VADTPFFETPLRTLKGIGPKRERALAHVGLATVGDLLSRLPYRYEDRSSFDPVAGVKEGERVTLAACSRSGPTRRTGRTPSVLTSGSSCTVRSSAFAGSSN